MMSELSAEKVQISLSDAKLSLQETVYIKGPRDSVRKDSFPKYTNMWEIKEKLSRDINANPHEIVMFHNNMEMDLWTPLAALPKMDNTAVVFRYELKEAKKGKEGGTTARNQLVRITDSDETVKLLRVQVIWERPEKQYCGGLLNKRTGTEFRHVWAQTIRPPRRADLPPLRDTGMQTITFPVEEETQTPCDHGVQTLVRGLYMPCHSDRIIQPGNYVEAEEHLRKMARIVQRALMRWVEKCRTMAINYAEAEKLKERQRMARALCSRMRESYWNYALCTAYPTDHVGFENLYAMVNEWHDGIRDKLLEVFSPSDVHYQSYKTKLFSKKVSYYSEIEKLRTRHQEETLNKLKFKKFDDSAKPIVRRYPKGHKTTIDTQQTQRAKEFKEMYSAYIRRDYKPVERIEMLLFLVQFLHNYGPVDVTIPIIDLINREIDMIEMGFKHLEGLQKRISEMLYHYFTLPEFDLKAIYETKPTWRCGFCGEVKPQSQFSQKDTKRKRCNSCHWLKQLAIGKPSFRPYEKLLEEVTKEGNLPNNMVLADMVLEEMYTLVTKIWGGRSVMSHHWKIDNLAIPRWYKNEKWTPWNCILLTKEEADFHATVSAPDYFYDEILVNEVKFRHNLAWKYFSRLRVNDSSIVNLSARKPNQAFVQTMSKEDLDRIIRKVNSPEELITTSSIW